MKGMEQMSLETLISVEKKEKLVGMIAEILEVEPEEIKDDTDLVEELDADSMMALELQNFTTVNNIISIIEERITEK